MIKGFRLGTFTARAAASYSGSDKKVILGELDLEYLKQISKAWRGVLSIEGAQDEWALVGEAQWHVSPHAFLKLNNGIGLTSKAPDWAPEVGVVFSF